MRDSTFYFKQTNSFVGLLCFFIAFFFVSATSFAQSQQAAVLVDKANPLLSDVNYSSPVIQSNSTSSEDDCSQETMSLSVENGFGPLHVFEFANDLTVNPYEDFILNSATFSILTQPGESISSADIYFYEDSETGTGPGAQIYSLPSVALTSNEVVGTAFSFDHRVITFDFDDPYTFTGSSTQSVYWVGIIIYYTGASSYLEVTTTLMTPNELYYYDSDLEVWISNMDNEVFGPEANDGVMSLFGECVLQVMDCPALEANIGDACDDGDEATINDVVSDDCECVGTPVGGDGLCAFENFDNSNLNPNSSSYADGSFVGNFGVTWTYVQARNENADANESGIDGKAIMLRRIADDSKITSSAVPGGISDFSVKLYKGFTGAGDRQVELFVNGVSQGLSDPFDDFEEHVFTVPGINIAGDVVIEIRNNTSRQIIIDDISWTCYGDTTYDCPDLEANVGDACDPGDGSTGELNEGCECVVPMAGSPCDQQTLGNNVENALGALHLLLFANDFTVNPNENFDLNSISFNVLTEPGGSINAADIYFYEDSETGTGPGTEMSSMLSLTPTSNEILGEAFGFDLRKITFEFDNAVTFIGSSSQSVYWVGVQLDYTGDNSYLEVTSTLNTPNEVYFFEEYWISSIDPDEGFDASYDGVMSLHGECFLLEEFNCPDLEANVGDACDDNDPETENDVITGNCECAGTVVIEFNNTCAEAIPLSCGDSITGTTLGATYSGATDNCTNQLSRDVYYTLDVTAGAEYTVTVNGDNYDAVIAMYTGECGSLVNLDCADNEFVPGGEESITWTATSTETIIIRTYDWTNAQESFVISVSCVVDVDCPSLNANIGDACDDGDDTTENDVVSADCECVGTPILADDQCAFENFNNSNIEVGSSSYADGSFLGNNGVTWTYVQARDENADANGAGIDGKAIMLRRIADGSKITSSAVPGGISDFSVKLYKGFTSVGDRQVELFVNGVSQGLSTPFDDLNEHIFTVEGINIAGDVTIEIRNNTSRQIIIDDISWTCIQDVVYECPDLEANIGDPCDDDDEMTENDMINTDCECVGTPIAVWECPEFEANIGDACDDGDDTTEDDMYNADCECVGTPIVVWECPEFEANIGDACDDGDDTTENDMYNADCECVGTPIVEWECPEIEANIGDPCVSDSEEDGVINEDCDCIIVGISDISGFSFTMYPNPAGSNESVTLTSNQSIDRYEVLDITGKLIDAKVILNQNEIVIALRNYSPGMYILKAYSGSDFSTQKMVVR